MEKFIRRAKEINGDKYDYSQVDYVNTKTKVKIICKIHGEFWQTPDKHINSKQGCPKCCKTHKLDYETVIKRFNDVHNNKYTYLPFEFNNVQDKITVVCPIHGEFKMYLRDHLYGNGCPKCFGKNKTNDEVIQELKKIHGDKYDYSKVNYLRQTSKLTIICPEHGEFYQTFNTHKKGHGCPKCAGNMKINRLEFIEKCINVCGDKYDYSKVNYINNHTRITVICPEHGEFKRMPYRLLTGIGCLKCHIRDAPRIKTSEQFISEARIIHSDKYDYSQVKYVGCKELVSIQCPIHGEFKQIPDSHIQGCGCPKCGLTYDKKEGEIKNFIKSLNISIIENSKKIIPPHELDIFIPSHNIGIEFDGLYWHSELHKPTNYHLNKTNNCNENDINLIHIFEDEWTYKQDIVKSRLKNILGLTENKLFARKCVIKLVDSKTSNIFLDINHIQGSVKSSINIGLYYNDTLVSLMCFNKPRSGIGTKYDGYELSRFCNMLNTNVIGSASRLLKHFENTYKPKEIISYADLRWSTGGLYEKLGFTLTHINKPNYWYVVNNKRKHRFDFRKSQLKKEGFDTENKTEREIMLERKVYKIYDCGTLSYKKTPE